MTATTQTSLPGQVLRLNRSYLERGFLVRFAPDGDSLHWQGGASTYAGASCPLCRMPLLLIWQIDCGAPELERLPGTLFECRLVLPLFYCFCQCTTLSYQVVGSDRIHAIETPDPDPKQAPPYVDFPRTLDRQAIALVPIPTALNNLFVLIQEIGSEEWMTDGDLTMMAKWLGRDVEDRPDVWRHQFGGAPYLVGGHEELLCPNLSCERSRPWVRNEIRFAMKELAVIHNDPAHGLPLFNSMPHALRGGDIDHWTQLVYHICDECLTLRVSMRRG